MGQGGQAIRGLCPHPVAEIEAVTAPMSTGFLARLWVVAGLPPWFSPGAPFQTLQSPTLPGFPAHSTVWLLPLAKLGIK